MMGLDYSQLLALLSISFAFCNGDQGSCPGCSEISCKKIECATGKYCIMQSVDCFQEPCPKLPTCVAASQICGSLTPHLDETEEVKDCLSGCPSSAQCIAGHCCSVGNSTVVTQATPHLAIPDAFATLSTDGEQWMETILKNDFSSNNGMPDKTPCKQCKSPLCLTARCPGHKDASCVDDTCTCVSWFVDTNGRMVDCGADIDVADPPIIKPILYPGIEMNSIPTVDVAKKQHSTTVYLELKNGNKTNDSWKFAVVAVCSFLFICVIGFMIFKFVERRRKHKNYNGRVSKKCTSKVPLGQVTTENNNDSKELKPLFNGPKAEEV